MPHWNWRDNNYRHYDYYPPFAKPAPPPGPPPPHPPPPPPKKQQKCNGKQKRNNKQKRNKQKRIQNQHTSIQHQLKCANQQIARLQKRLHDRGARKQRHNRRLAALRRKLEPGMLGKITSFKDIAELDEGYLREMELRESFVQAGQLRALVEPSRAISKLVGLRKCKKQLFQMVMGALARKLVLGESSGALHNMIISGPPGVGKTTLCDQIGAMLHACGVLTKGHVVHAARKDLISQWVGKTAIQTTEIVQSAIGGVLVIDEVYSLGSTNGGRNNFAQEAVDTLNQLMSLHAHELVVVAAGYWEEIQERFLVQNKGLASRFPIRMHLEKYSATELADIFFTKLDREEEKYENAKSRSKDTKDTMHALLADKQSHFKHQGRDMSTLAKTTTSIALSRAWCVPCIDRKDVQEPRAGVEDLKGALKRKFIGGEKKKEDRGAAMNMYS